MDIGVCNGDADGRCAVVQWRAHMPRPARYLDHPHVDDISQHPLLQAHIDVASNTCASLLMDQHLGGQFRAWALVGAFGDNLTADLGLPFEAPLIQQKNPGHAGFDACQVLAVP